MRLMAVLGAGSRTTRMLTTTFEHGKLESSPTTSNLGLVIFLYVLVLLVALLIGKAVAVIVVEGEGNDPSNTLRI